MVTAVVLRPADADAEANEQLSFAETTAANVAARVALVAPRGQTQLDGRIRTAQAKVRERPDEVARWERLATLFITKARVTGDPGHYQQAEACADAMPTEDGGADAAALLRGHVRHALHDFDAAERIARDLVARRGSLRDHGLLGDVLLDRGQLDAAERSYQAMLDLRPGLLSYSRAAELQWLRGNHAACRRLLADAAAAGSRRDPESLAWVLARRGRLELESSDAEAALQFAERALELVDNHPAALLVQGRAALALDRTDLALTSLAAAAAAYPLPQHLWGHAEALTRAGHTSAVETTLAELRANGREDPRTFALWLATRGEHPELAVRHATAEAALRQDAQTLDVLGFALLRAGDVAGSNATLDRALATGLDCARLHLHAALARHAVGAPFAAHLERADAGRAALWPSEQRELDRLIAGR